MDRREIHPAFAGPDSSGTRRNEKLRSPTRPLRNQNLWLVLLANLEQLTSEQMSKLIATYHTHRQKGEFPSIAQLATETKLVLNKKGPLFNLLSQATFNYPEIPEAEAISRFLNNAGFTMNNMVRPEVELVEENGQRRTRERFSITPFGSEAAGTIASLFEKGGLSAPLTPLR